MARTIKQIQEIIITSLKDEGITLSDSKTSEGRLWAFVVATSIQIFEVVIDSFKKEVDQVADRIIRGTIGWYVDQCRRWQSGHELLYNPETTELYYAIDDPSSRLITIVAITEGEKRLAIKVAKADEENKIIPLSEDEIHDFRGYIESVKFVGIEVDCSSTDADKIKYVVDVYYNPTIPRATVDADVKVAIDKFRTDLGFDSLFYKQRFIDVMMRVNGVVTVDLKELVHTSASQTEPISIGVMSELDAGYFDFTDDSVVECKLIK